MRLSRGSPKALSGTDVAMDRAMAPNKRRLGTTDLEIKTVGFGAWAIGGGGWAYGWGPQDAAGSLDLDTSALSRIAGAIELTGAGSGPVACQWKGAA